MITGANYKKEDFVLLDEEKIITVDLRGKKCPMTFVYTKLALEAANEGDVIRVILDYPPAFENVPRSVKIQQLGTIVGIEKDRDEGSCNLIIKKDATAKPASHLNQLSPHQGKQGMEPVDP